MFKTYIYIPVSVFVYVGWNQSNIHKVQLQIHILTLFFFHLFTLHLRCDGTCHFECYESIINFLNIKSNAAQHVISMNNSNASIHAATMFYNVCLFKLKVYYTLTRTPITCSEWNIFHFHELIQNHRWHLIH